MVIRGIVQGVGFRYFVLDAANALRVVGHVRNLPDGVSVGVVAEGGRAQLETLAERMAHGPRASRVDEVKVRWDERVTGEFSGFRIVL